VVVAATGLAPGVYLEEVRREPAPEFHTGVPAFLGGEASDASGRALTGAVLIDGWEAPGSPELGGTLRLAVRGFFENGGPRCYVVPGVLDSPAAVQAAMASIDALDEIDLVCAPGLAAISTAGELSRLQAEILRCAARRSGLFAILDPIRTTGATTDIQDSVKEHRAALDASIGGDERSAAGGALYFPWIKIEGAGLIPPCGHVAGVYARTDRRVGVHKAPANEVLQGVIDLEAHVSAEQQGDLNERGINCVRAFPGRGIRIWGARTLSADPAWTYVSVRRLVLTIARWLESSMAALSFEPNDLALWIRISREVSALLQGLFERGALKGRTAAEAFFVKCDAETNPLASREAGQVVAEVGLAPASPNEFVLLRLVRGEHGVRATADFG
jgi:hypothetical protein